MIFGLRASRLVDAAQPRPGRAVRKACGDGAAHPRVTAAALLPPCPDLCSDLAFQGIYLCRHLPLFTGLGVLAAASVGEVANAGSREPGPEMK